MSAARGLHFAIDRRAAVKGAIRDAAAEALRDAVEHLLTEANRTVPHDEGTLERSGNATVDTGRLRGCVSYDTPYAVRQHEDTRIRHPGKGRAKWLEHTFREQADQVGEFIADRIREAID